MRRRLSLLAALSLAVVHVASALEIDVGYNPEDIFQSKQESKDKFDEPYTFSHDIGVAMSHGYDAVTDDSHGSSQAARDDAPLALNRSPSFPYAPRPANYAAQAPYSQQAPSPQPAPYGPVAALVPGNIQMPQLVATLQNMMGYSGQPPPVYYASTPDPCPPPPCPPPPSPTTVTTTIVCCPTSTTCKKPTVHTVYVSIESHKVKPTCHAPCSDVESDCEEPPKHKHKHKHSHSHKHTHKHKHKDDDDCTTSEKCTTTKDDCEPTTEECTITTEACETVTKKHKHKHKHGHKHHTKVAEDSVVCEDDDDKCFGRAVLSISSDGGESVTTIGKKLCQLTNGDCDQNSDLDSDSEASSPAGNERKCKCKCKGK
ncbi:hypothetical protein LPJ61_000659, partial [Coemansia biformis]